MQLLFMTPSSRDIKNTLWMSGRPLRSFEFLMGWMFWVKTNTSQTGHQQEYSCRLCGAQGHSAFGCSRYNTHKIRLDRCEAAGLCTLCTSSKHNPSKCPGKDGKMKYPCRICKGRSHIGAMCPKFVPKGY